jgi:hypothetical protein
VFGEVWRIVLTHDKLIWKCFLMTIMNLRVASHMTMYEWLVIWILNVKVRPSSGRAMAQAVSRRPLTSKDWVPVRVNPCGICDE